MMRTISLLLLSLCFLTGFKNPVMTGLRENYNKTVADKKLCENTIRELRTLKNMSPTQLAYLGGLQAIWANHVFNPIDKLGTFNKGKKNIERAIFLEPNNIELRFIRLSIQKNTPSFLGYKSNIKEDTILIMEHRKIISSEILIKNIDTLLKN